MPHSAGFAVFAALLLASALAESAAAAMSKNGFDVSNATVRAREIVSGGVRRDGIPAIDEPQFVSVPDVDFLLPHDIVIGVHGENSATAYPTRILVWHEVVNDEIDDRAIAVTYCPLCATGMVFERKIGGRVLSFGVSGLLYRSDMLMYDRATESLWSQLGMTAISGPLAGTPLTLLPSEHMSWREWRKRFPDSRVLSTKTGFHRNYAASAYKEYFQSDKVMFPVPRKRRDLPMKSLVLGILLGDVAKAYPVERLAESGEIEDDIGTIRVTVRYDAATKRAAIADETGELLPSVVSYWFAWQAFYPETEIWQGSD